MLISEKIMLTAQYNFSTRLLFFIYISILVPFLILTMFLHTEIRDDIYEEKQEKLFGLTILLDKKLNEGFEDILRQEDALGLSRDEQIAVLNSRLRDQTDLIASANPGVGVGYYAKDLDGVLTYGPSREFQYTVGFRIKEGHEGLVVMETGEARVQIGQLVRGNIMNCMHPIIRDSEVIGYIWANETVDSVQTQMRDIMKRVYLSILLILVAIYISVYIVSRIFLNGILVLKSEIETLMAEPNHRLPAIGGELNIISEKVNELVNSVSFEKSYNRYILDAVVSAVLVVSNEGTITRTNRAFFELFKHLGPDIHGKKSLDVFGKEVEGLIEEGLLRDTYCDGCELELFGRTLKLSSNNVIDEQERRLGLILIFQDITLIRKYEHELIEKERLAALGELSLGVAHEIKNPLTSVKGFTQMLQRPNLKDAKKNDYLNIMEAELNRVNRLLNELLLYGGQSPLRKQDENVVDIIDGLLTEYLSVSPNVEFERKILQDVDFVIQLDKHKIIQVFENVIKNAVDAVSSRDKGKIEIGINAASEHITIVFRDNGSGISSENLEKIFNPFFTTKDRGTGFGLPICYRIIKRHGGDIMINSTEGEFTEVIIKLSRTAGE